MAILSNIKRKQVRLINLEVNFISNLFVEFQDISVQGDTVISEWNWAFGDGQASNEQHPSNIYTGFGIYSVSLRVTDKNNCYNLIV